MGDKNQLRHVRASSPAVLELTETVGRVSEKYHELRVDGFEFVLAGSFGDDEQETAREALIEAINNPDIRVTDRWGVSE